MVVAAMTIGVAAVGSVLSAYSVLTRELSNSYATTNPSTATIHLATDSAETGDAGAVAAALAQPDVLDAELRGERSTRVHLTANEWTPLTLVVVEDFTDVRIERFSLAQGQRLPAADEILIERSSLDEAPIDVGDQLQISATGGTVDPVPLTVAGLTHDQGRTPAWMTGRLVGYVTPEALVRLGVNAGLSELLVTTDPAASRSENHVTATRLVASLEAAGIDIERIEVPVPGEHPAQGVLQTMMFLLQAFGALALLASSALVGTLITAQLKQQRREIGVMKSTGATTSQLGGLYVRTVIVLGCTAIVAGIPLGLLGARGLVGFTLGLLNIAVTSYAVAGWVFVAQAGLALALPIAAVAYPVWAASTISTKDLLSGEALDVSRTTRRIGGPGRMRTLGLRNVTRTPSRTITTALGVALGGAAFMTALNTGSAWNRAVENEFDSRRYDLAVQLDGPYDQVDLRRALAATEAVAELEVWNQFPASIASAHDQFTLFVPPATTDMVDYPMLEGRWLRASDTNALVLNQLVEGPGDGPALEVGSVVDLVVDGSATSWTIVGIAKQLGGGENGVAYASGIPDGIPDDNKSGFNHVRLATDSLSALSQVDQALALADIRIANIATASEGREALEDHLMIIVGLLMIMAILICVVGGLGLVEAMSITVLERRRELGVMRAIGASTGNIVQILTVEGVAIAVLSWGFAAGLSVPMTLIVENVAGNLFLQTPLPTTFYSLGALIWLIIVVVLSAAASAIPALETTESPVHQALALR